jgi:hypothetical protein
MDELATDGNGGKQGGRFWTDRGDKKCAHSFLNPISVLWTFLFLYAYVSATPNSSVPSHDCHTLTTTNSVVLISTVYFRINKPNGSFSGTQDF